MKQKAKEPIIKGIEKHLPKQIKEPLKRIYAKWNSKIILDKGLIKDLIEFYNANFNYHDFKLSYSDTIFLCKLGTRLNADLWNIINPKTEEEIKKFYEITPYYLFEAAYVLMDIQHRRFRKRIMNYAFGDVLDYRGGIGIISLELAKKGLNVTYGDVSGITMNFAKWLFEKRGYAISVIDLEREPELLREYDTIICRDVIEHIPHPEVVLERMARCLKENGRLIITQLKSSGPVEDAPMHFEINFDKAEKLLNLFGVFNSGVYEWLRIKKEDDKIKESKGEGGDGIG